MIKLLGQIEIPEQLVNYLKTAQPTRIASQLASASFKEQRVMLAREHKANVDNYKFYTEENTGTIEYREDWFKSIVPNEFLQQHGLSSLVNATVLQVNPGHFTAPHIDRYKTSVYSHDANIEFDSIVRLWIPVEDRKMGQALFCEDEVLYNFKAGEVYTFGNYDLHSGANAGLDVRYTLLAYAKRLGQTKISE
jgi:hypothetical protein